MKKLTRWQAFKKGIRVRVPNSGDAFFINGPCFIVWSVDMITRTCEIRNESDCLRVSFESLR